MDDQTTTRLLIAGGFALVGVLLLVYVVWARHGGSPAAQAWMGNDFGSRTVDERMTVLGAPMLGLICLCVAAGVLPVVGKHLMLITFPLAGLLFLPFFWAAMLFLPLPDLIYPRWARPLRERNRRAETSMKQWLRRH